MLTMKRLRWLPTLFGLLLLVLQPLSARAAGTRVLVLTIDGAITRATQTYLARGLELAARQDAEVVILQLNTPGGYVEVTKEMAQEIRASTVPVVVYVSPRGAWAASAGTVITLAGHAAAMAPETTIGAAIPVGSQGQDLPSDIRTKEIEGMQAIVRAYAERRPPEAVALAEATIASAEAVSATEALQIGLVDFVAADLDDLLAQLDGYTVQMETGPRTLHTAGLPVEQAPMSFIEQLLQILVDPNIVFLLLSIGALALLIELASPGGWVAGFIGVVCLALAGYGMGLLSVNWFGIIFLLTAFVLFFLDVKAATHGGLTAAGIGAFIVGALVLFNSPGTPDIQRVSLPLVILVALLIGIAFAVIVGFALRAQKTRIRTGTESMPGRTGTAVSSVGRTGQVQAAGELWSAEAVPGSEPIRKGDRVEVVKVEGLRLKVKKS
jgi:membrane-bound serine protease (ClpP class)